MNHTQTNRGPARAGAGILHPVRQSARPLLPAVLSPGPPANCHPDCFRKLRPLTHLWPQLDRRPAGTTRPHWGLDRAPLRRQLHLVIGALESRGALFSDDLNHTLKNPERGDGAMMSTSAWPLLSSVMMSAPFCRRHSSQLVARQTENFCKT